MLPKGPPRILKNCKKFVCAPLQNPPESPSRRDREKSGSRTLPETSPCASRTINTMVLAGSTKCLQTFFSSLLGSFWHPFCHLGRMQITRELKQSVQKKNIKTTSTIVSKCNRKVTKSRPNLKHFLHALGLDRPRDRPGTPEAPSEDYLGTHSHPTSRNLSRSAYRTCTCRVSNSRGCSDDPPQASSIFSIDYLVQTLAHLLLQRHDEVCPLLVLALDS